MEAGIWRSPKRFKAQKTLDLEDIDEQQWTQRSVDNFKQTFKQVVTPDKEQGVEPGAMKSTPKRGKGQGVEAEATVKSTPKRGKGHVVEAEARNSPSKRKKGAHKNVALEAVEVSRKESKKLDEFEPDSDDDETVTRSESASLRGGENNGCDPQSTMDQDGDGEDHNPTTKHSGRKGRQSKAKKPVAERVSVSKVTRAAKAISPKV